MGARETAIFRFVVPRSARRARRVLAISQRTKDDLVELYGLPSEKIVVTPLAADPAFRPGGTRGDYVLLSGSIEPRKNPLAAAEAARVAGRKLVVVGPERDAALAAERRARGGEGRAGGGRVARRRRPLGLLCALGRASLALRQSARLCPEGRARQTRP